MDLYQTILIPTDDSEYSRSAIAHGLKLARATGAKVIALNVIDELQYAYFLDAMAVNNLIPQLEAEGRSAVNHVVDEGKKMGVPVTAEVKKGNPADKIIEASKSVDLVVMGTMGRTGLSHLLMGSVAEKVVRFAACPVLLVRAR